MDVHVTPVGTITCRTTLSAVPLPTMIWQCSEAQNNTSYTVCDVRVLLFRMIGNTLSGAEEADPPTAD